MNGYFSFVIVFGGFMVYVSVKLVVVFIFIFLFMYVLFGVIGWSNDG